LTRGLLREHGAAGRLDMDELEQRIGAAYSARTHGELGALVRDLPGRLPVPRAARAQVALSAYGSSRSTSVS
jgi:hypothetical protein